MADIRKSGESYVQMPDDYAGNVKFRSSIVPNTEIPTGYAAAICYPRDWYDLALAGRHKEIYYRRIGNKPLDDPLGWEMCVKTSTGDLRPVHRRELDECKFMRVYPVLWGGERVEVRTRWTLGYSREDEHVLTDMRVNTAEVPEVRQESEFVRLGQIAREKQEQRDRELAAKANEWDDVFADNAPQDPYKGEYQCPSCGLWWSQPYCNQCGHFPEGEPDDVPLGQPIDWDAEE